MKEHNYLLPEQASYIEGYTHSSYSVLLNNFFFYCFFTIRSISCIVRPLNFNTSIRKYIGILQLVTAYAWDLTSSKNYLFNCLFLRKKLNQFVLYTNVYGKYRTTFYVFFCLWAIFFIYFFLFCSSCSWSLNTFSNFLYNDYLHFHFRKTNLFFFIIKLLNWFHHDI